jgi:DNA-binding NarL/FixJ family response regulator
LVGRESELARLDATLEALDGGAGGCLAIEGEPGIGKTTLLSELRGRAENRGFAVLAGAAAEFEREQPFSVWIDALDAYAVAQDLPANDAWNDALAAELGPVLPSLAVSNGRGTIPDERYRTHRAVRSLLGVLSEDRPLVVVLDDLHWSDSASLELLAALVRRELTAPVLLALGYRSGHSDTRLAATVSAARVERVRLGLLSEAEAAQMLTDLSAPAAAAIYRQAGGNPFYLRQLGRSSDGGSLPASLAGAIAEELEALSESSRAMLNGAAVSGEPFEPDLAAAVAGIGDDEGLDALDDLLQREIVRATDLPRRFVFRHPLVRQTVYESAGGGWRLAAHRRADAELASRGASAAERARHVEQAAVQGDEDSIALLLEAGDAAAPRAPSAASRWYAAALRLLPADDRPRQVSVREALAGALRAAGDLELCRSTILEAIPLLEPDEVDRGVALTALCAAVEHWQGRHDEAHRRLTRAWQAITNKQSLAAGTLRVELAVDGFYGAEDELALTLEVGAGALEVARTIGDVGLIARAAAVLALAEAAVWRSDEARAHREEAIRAVDQLDDAELAGRLETLYYLGWAENYLEEFDCAIERSQRGVEIARASGNGRLLMPMMLLACYPLEWQGRLAEVRELTETAVEIARLGGTPHYLFWSLFEQAWAHYFGGRLDEAIAAGEESAKAGGRLSGGTIPSSGGGPGWALAVSHFELGEIDRALELMYELGSADMEKWIPAERCINWENLALAELARDDLDAAVAIADRADAEAARTSMNFPRLFASRTRAAVEQARGDLSAATLAAEAAVAASAAIPARMQTAFSNALLGQILAAQEGERTRAVEVLREAERELDACGSLRARDAVRRDLRKLGARSEVRGPATGADAGLESLTAREREIADLVADRLTNPQIAEKLFLSKKTVESHIRNLFVKLGVSSRVDIARLVERDRRQAA